MTAPTPGPWTMDARADGIWAPSAKGGETKIFDIRGWGYLTGKGSGALGLPDGEAIAIQTANGKLAAAAPLLLDAAKDLAKEPCTTLGAEDIEPGCCPSCRARRAVAAATI